MTKKTIAPKDPFAGKRLNKEHRRKIMNFAAERFMDHELRAKEKAAFAAVVAGLRADSDAISADLEVLSKYQRVREVRQVSFYGSRNVNVGKKEFELPNGDKVERDHIRQVKFRKGYDEPLNWTGNEWYDVASVMQTAIEDACCAGTSNLLIGGSTLKIPCDRNEVAPHVSTTEYSNYSNDWLVWISEPTNKLIDAFYLANEARFMAEMKLLHALWKVVAANNGTFGGLTAIWPEVIEIEEDLFGVKPVVAQALSVLNEDDIALLCNAMSSRGVHSNPCMVASSPANAEMLAAAE
jgi:hypothetical protein